MAYLAGNEDIPRTFRAWRDGHRNDSEMALEYSRFVLDLLTSLSAEGYLNCTSTSRRDCVRAGGITVEQQRWPPNTRLGAAYHGLELVRGLRRMLAALRRSPDVLVVNSGTIPLYLLVLPWLLGKRQVLVLHAALWPVLRRPDRVHGLLLRLAGPALRSPRTVVIGVSATVVRQVESMFGERATRHSGVFLPRYLQSWAQDAPRQPGTRWEVLLPGRVERTKGVFDMIEATRLIVDTLGRDAVHVTIAGDGSRLAELRALVARLDLQDVVELPGFCESHRMRELYARSDIVVAPSRTVFNESFNKVLAEAVLSHRPVVTSQASPGVDYVRDAAVVAEPDRADDYARAIMALMTDAELYEQKKRACSRLASQFLEPGQDLGVALGSALGHLLDQHSVRGKAA